MNSSSRYAIFSILFTGMFASGIHGQESVTKRPLEIGLCELVKHSSRYVGALVRVHGSFVSDGMDRSALVDPNCKRGLEPRISPDLADHPDIEAFNAALDRGEKGTLDKQVTATFTGVFRCRPDCTGPGMRVLYVTEIRDLKVETTKPMDR